MSPSWYLGIMLSIVAVATAISAPLMLTVKCAKCGARSGLEAKQCRKCGHPFPEDDTESVEPKEGPADE